MSRGLKTVMIVLTAAIGLVWSQPISAQDIECAKCHTSAETLKKLTKNLGPKGPRSTMGVEIKQTARYKRVLIDQAFFEDENHGELECNYCHGGDPNNSDFKTAHNGVDRDPSYPAPGICSDCHDETEHYAKSLHYNIRGMKLAVDARVNPDRTVRRKVFNSFANCARCHSSCGQCHINQPVSIGGGFSAGHRFQKSPSMEKTCGACHASGVSEFTGKNKSFKPDIHHENEMECMDCHTQEQMHGDGNMYDSRHDVENGPVCLDCHEEIFTDDGENKETHAAHKDEVSCHVCHSQPYNNCADCHLTKDWGPGKFKSWTAFKIGLNPKKTDKRPESFVTLRHAPTYPDIFKADVADGLTNFNKLPTWTLATPHNIRRKTPQNSDCNNCHGNWNLFLMRKDVDTKLIKANRRVIVPPSKIPVKLLD